MQADAGKIDVIIPNWNGAEMLQHCLQSLQHQSFKEFTVIVVDNGSTDGSVELLASQFPDVRVVQFDHNTGFSVAVNAGIGHSKAELLLLLNNDMEVASDCLEQLYSAARACQEFDFFALKMVSFKQRDIIDGAGDALLRGGVGYRLGTLELDSGKYSQDKEVFGACGGAALYRRTFFDVVGTFDEDFFAYVEDVDLNIRARRAGLRCLFLSSATVYHIGSATSGSKINPFTIRLSTRNNLKVLIKHYPVRYFFRFGVVICIYQCMWLLFCLKKNVAGAWFKGVLEALRTMPETLKKRKINLEGVSSEEHRSLAEQIITGEREAIESIISRRTQQGKGSSLLRLYCKIFCS